MRTVTSSPEPEVEVVASPAPAFVPAPFTTEFSLLNDPVKLIDRSEAFIIEGTLLSCARMGSGRAADFEMLARFS